MALPLEQREDRPAYVQFERRGEEDRARTMKEGRYIEKDVDFAIITPIGSKDRIPRKVEDWFKQLEQQVREERIPAAWLQQYRAAYEAWKAGQEIPVNGTPIRGWPVLSPAQQANVISANVLTVEDLAQANGEARQRIGMGAEDLVEKAIAWLKAARAQGIPTQEVSALQAKIRLMEEQLKNKDERIKELEAELKELQKETA
jgi:hypothetical protein